MEEKKCCICGLTFTEWGNNPWPISENETDVCCDMCNSMVVIPARINLMYTQKKGDDK